MMHADSAGEGMSPIVRTVAGWLKGFILLYGIYIVLYGHVTPGGGFAGGVIVACAFVLITLAEGGRMGLAHFGRGAASTLDCVGLLLFWVIAMLGMAIAPHVFFHNFISAGEEARFTLFSAGAIPVSNVGIGLKVGCSLFLVFIVLSVLRVTPAREPGKEGTP